ncbi:MAG: restriction endonuclease [Bacilli bacterium]|nr:restriction endonuclease [Bacilli bacterium]
MKKGRLYNRQEIEVISKSAIGKTMNDILKEELVSIGDIDNKGGLGQLIEQYLFGIQTNNESEPDFMPAGIELKVTPYKKIKGGKLSAKERLVLNIINYMEEWKNDFRHSHFWMKNNTIQLLWYLWEPNKDFKDFKITHEKLMELVQSEDIKQIENDWNYIVSKIKEGKAHELSEADTMYLGTCTKGVNSSSTREQPFSDIKAMQRAFCFKNSYMTQMVRKIIGDYSDVEKVLKGTNNTFNEYVNNVIEKYKGKTQKELMKEFSIDSKAKNINSMLISRMFNVTSKLADTEEFQKANIIPKTIRIEESGRIKESISFPSFKFNEIIEQEWETCDLREELETTKYMFFVFKKEKGEYVFKGIKLWNMPETDIETSVMEMWKKTYNTILNGNIVRYIKDGKRKTNFVGMSENEVCHVRPHGRDSRDTFKLPVADKLTGATEYTKQCFWINSNYIKGIFEEFN